jgi:hypothetical protein
MYKEKKFDYFSMYSRKIFTGTAKVIGYDRKEEISLVCPPNENDA